MRCSPSLARRTAASRCQAPAPSWIFLAGGGAARAGPGEGGGGMGTGAGAVPGSHRGRGQVAQGWGDGGPPPEISGQRQLVTKGLLAPLSPFFLPRLSFPSSNSMGLLLEIFFQPGHGCFLSHGRYSLSVPPTPALVWVLSCFPNAAPGCPVPPLPALLLHGVMRRPRQARPCQGSRCDPCPARADPAHRGQGRNRAPHPGGASQDRPPAARLNWVLSENFALVTRKSAGVVG